MKRIRESCLENDNQKMKGVSGCLFFTGEDLSKIRSKSIKKRIYDESSKKMVG